MAESWLDPVAAAMLNALWNSSDDKTRLDEQQLKSGQVRGQWFGVTQGDRCFGVTLSWRATEPCPEVTRWDRFRSGYHETFVDLPSADAAFEEQVRVAMVMHAAFVLSGES